MEEDLNGRGKGRAPLLKIIFDFNIFQNHRLLSTKCKKTYYITETRLVHVTIKHIANYWFRDLVKKPYRFYQGPVPK